MGRGGGGGHVTGLVATGLWQRQDDAREHVRGVTLPLACGVTLPPVAAPWAGAVSVSADNTSAGLVYMRTGFSQGAARMLSLLLLLHTSVEPVL